MFTRRTAVAIVTAVTVAMALSSCAADSAGDEVAEDCTPVHPDLETIADGALTVAAYVSPPYTVEEGDTISGVDGDIVAALAEKECLSLEISSVAGAALPSSIDSGRADIAVGGVYASPERAESFSLSEPMYLDQAAILSRDGIDSIEGLDGNRLGVIQGYLWNAEFQKALGTDNVKVYQTSASLISDIKNGRVDAGAFTSAEASLRATEDADLSAEVLAPTPDVPSSEKPNDVVLLLNKDAGALTDALNEDISALLDDGTIADILEEYGIDPELAASE